jgi:hypothetical protein
MRLTVEHEKVSAMKDLTIYGIEVSGNAVFILLFLIPIALVGNWKLFAKAGQPGWAAAIPGYNVVVAMRILGRPAAHAAYFLIPGFNVYFFFRTLVELAQSFGKKSWADYALVCIFNVLYVINLGLSYEEEYVGPAHGSVSARESNGIGAVGYGA